MAQFFSKPYYNRLACVMLSVSAAASPAFASSGDRLVTGIVVLDDSGMPVAGARVGAQGSDKRTTTDCSGRFTITTATPTPARIVAWKAGYYIAGADSQSRRSISIRLKRIPLEDSDDYQWVDPNPDPEAPQNCANCHAGIYREWSASSHATTAVNRHFLNMFYGTDWSGKPDAGWSFQKDQPDAKAVCSACHLPTVQASSPIAEDPARVAGVAREGIHCDFCHKIADSEFAYSLDSLGLQHGRDALRVIRPASSEQVFFGPLDDVDRGRDTFAPIYRSSVYCASCHEGTLFGTRVYETFSEWLASSYAKRGVECQDCHMKSDGTTRNIAPGHGGIERDPATLSTHHFPGSMNESVLRSSVELDLKGHREGSLIHAVVAVRAVNVGHRLPTGSPERHVLLVVRCTDEHGNDLVLGDGPVISSLGGRRTTAGVRGLEGLPGKIYGKVLQGPGGETPVPFWRAVGTSSDTRLEPDQTDTVRLAFEDKSGERVQLAATLIYRRFYKAILDAKAWPDADVVLAQKRMTLAPK